MGAQVREVAAAVEVVMMSSPKFATMVEAQVCYTGRRLRMLIEIPGLTEEVAAAGEVEEEVVAVVVVVEVEVVELVVEVVV